MKTQESLLLELDNLSPEDELLVNHIKKDLDDWTTPREVARYLKRSMSTIYEMIDNEEFVVRRMGGRLRILSASLIFVLEKR